MVFLALITKIVALRKESVDRNQRIRQQADAPPVVALRKESVDRNKQSHAGKRNKQKSLSARRAWIEIAPPGRVSSVCGSLSARRAWIEIRSNPP